MPRTLDQAFDLFHSNLKPSGSVTLAATRHRASIKASIEKVYTLDYFFQSGSSGNSTDIYPFSDVDYMAVIPTNQLTANSSTMMTNVRNQLDATFPRTGVHISTPAVVVPFGYNGSETTEVVPADLLKFNGDVPIFEISDGKGGWIKTAPKAHNAYVTRINQENNFQLKTFVRFIKAWKYYNSVDISSFYLEMRAAKYVESFCKNDKKVFYWIDLYYFFNELVESGLAQLQDPTGNVGYIAPCTTELKRQAALTSMNLARSRAKKAMDAAASNDISGAFSWFNLLFNGKFPSYYF